MERPNNYENTKTGGFTPVTPGGHHLVIKQVVESKSKTNKNMIVILFDMAKNDSQPEYMSEEFKNDIRPEKKWPHAGTQYILTVDEKGNCSKSFKSFITAFEKSNNCEAVWGEKFMHQFRNKKIGGVFGEVENEYNGKTFMRSELRWFCADSEVDGANVPATKYLNKANTAAPTPSSSTESPFIPAADSDETIPWG